MSHHKLSDQNSVANRYQKHPYPPVPFFLLPKLNQGQALALEFANDFIQNETPLSHQNKNILIVGCGTFEACVVALNHPFAKKITCIDLSQKSLNILKKRFISLKIKNILSLRFIFKPLPFLEFICTDLHQYKPPEKFDYILATHVLQHTKNPQLALTKCAELLVAGGWIRVVTYPKQSRIWMRATAKFFKTQNLAENTESLLQKCKKIIAKLDAKNPLKSCYISQPETSHLNGLLDAFFHPLENPISPLDWYFAATKSGLKWMGEAQTITSQSEYLHELCSEAKDLWPWVKLQILDDVLELCANPILWFRKETFKPDNFLNQINEQWQQMQTNLPESTDAEIKLGLKRVCFLLNAYKLDATFLLEKILKNIMPRVHPKNTNQQLEGLSLASESDKWIRWIKNAWPNQEKLETP